MVLQILIKILEIGIRQELTDMCYMFNGATNFNQDYISNWGCFKREL